MSCFVRQGKKHIIMPSLLIQHQETLTQYIKINNVTIIVAAILCLKMDHVIKLFSLSDLNNLTNQIIHILFFL